MSPTVRPPLRTVAALAVVLAAVSSACGDEARSGDPTLQIRVTVDPNPPGLGGAQVLVDVADADWTPRNGARVTVTGIRDDVPMGVDTARGEGAGRYVAPSFVFHAPGDWVLTVRVELADGRWTEIQRPLRVVAGE